MHGQTLRLTEQHLHHILVFTHCGMEEEPLHKLLSFMLVGAIYILHIDNKECWHPDYKLRVVTHYSGTLTLKRLHHHKRGGSVFLPEQTITNGAIAARLPKFLSLKSALFRDFPGMQTSLNLRSAYRS